MLRHEARRGFGAALRTGLAQVQYPLVFYTACDYPYPPADLTKLLEVIDSVDLASGCRTDPVPRWMRWAGAVYRLLVRVVFGIHLDARPGWRGWDAWRRGVRLRLLFGLRLWDVPSAFKLFRRSVLERIPIQSDGQFVHAEILAKANFLGCLMAEVPIGRLPGHFRGVPELTPAGVDEATELWRVFRDPRFVHPPSPEPAGPGLDAAPKAPAAESPDAPPLGGARSGEAVETSEAPGERGV